MLKLFINNGKFRTLLMYRVFNGVGSGMFSVFMMWLIHAYYQNPLYTGIAGFLFTAPGVASFLIGPFVDHSNKVAILRVTGLVKLCVVGSLLAIAFTVEWPGVWIFHLGVLLFSISNVFGFPARVSLLPCIVTSDELIKANTLHNIIAAISGLGVGVLLFVMMNQDAGMRDIVLFGTSTVLFMLALFFALLTRSCESKMENNKKASVKTYFAELAAGFFFIRQGVMLYLITGFIIINLFVEFAAVNLPMFAEIYTGMAAGYLILVALGVAGGLLGPVFVRFLAPRFSLAKIFTIGIAAVGITRIFFVHIIDDDLSLALLIFVLSAGMSNAISIFSQTLMQKLPPKSMLARIDTTETTLHSIAGAIGALLGGLAGLYLPRVDMVFYIQGVSYIFIAVILGMSGHIRGLPMINDVQSRDVNE